MGICHCRKQEEETNRRGRSHSLCFTPTHDDRWIMRITAIGITNHSSTAQHSIIRSPLNHSKPFSSEWTVRRTFIASFILAWKPQAFAPPILS
ncbi:hypothetical protein TNCV_3167491 [Trichonephila clavipes]|uniref:Uncharacterized protein n=1 Tax=Trichonephila clavipes TaxID=2585209 RepID=A0A8X6V165_TRICX|nr:hypothetical protein TNCV_3167491 [Trichonephila clavipes]